MAIISLFDRGVSFRGDLSYFDVQKMLTKDDVMIKDYLGIGEQSGFIILQLEINIAQINKNEADINDNTDDIQTNKENFEAHDQSDAEHGVMGFNVGDEDFCTDLIGGVVLLMDLVNDAVNSTETISIADIAAAPVAYDQVYTQTLADMANDTKAKHNQLVADLNSAIAQINDIIDKAKTAKQMSV